MKYLVITDIDKIQDYIFATDRLKEIRGASANLADFNDRKKVAERLGGGKLIIAAGGQTVAIFDSRDMAKKFVAKEVENFWEITGQPGLSAAILAYENDFKEANDRAQQILKSNKQAKDIKINLASSVFFKSCEICGERPAAKMVEEEAICLKCIKKQNSASRKSLLKRVRFEHLKPAEDIDAIGEKSENKIALIYADVNDVSEIIRDLDENQLNKFSIKLDETLLSVAKTVINEHFPDAGTAMFEPVLIGGDDFMIIVPADKAFRLANEFCAGVEKEMKDNLSEFVRDKKPTICASVIITKSNYPIYITARLAKQAITAAKKERKVKSIEEGMMTWLLVNHSAPVNYESIEKQWRRANYYLTKRPYTHSDFKELLHFADEAKTHIPRNKLSLIESQFSRYLTEQPEVLAFELLLMRYKRLSREARKVWDEFCTKFNPNDDDFPWTRGTGIELNKESTAFIDLVELSEYV